MPAPLRRACGGRRGSVGRGLVWWCLGWRLQPRLTRRPDRREGALSLATALGQGSWLKREVAARHRVGRPSGPGGRDYGAWSLQGLTTEWTGPEGSNELGGEDGARPQRGPGR
jgi:hypothetical protein